MFTNCFSSNYRVTEHWKFTYPTKRDTKADVSSTEERISYRYKQDWKGVIRAGIEFPYSFFPNSGF